MKFQPVTKEQKATETRRNNAERRKQKEVFNRTALETAMRAVVEAMGDPDMSNSERLAAATAFIELLPYIKRYGGGD